jgi:hypothetical protein
MPRPVYPASSKSQFHRTFADKREQLVISVCRTCGAIVGAAPSQAKLHAAERCHHCKRKESAANSLDRDVAMRRCGALRMNKEFDRMPPVVETGPSVFN